MRKLDFNEYKTSQMLAALFEKSIDDSNFSSPMFIRCFMTSDFTKHFENKSILSISTTVENIIEDLNLKYKASTKNPMYTKNEMYWIGYIYSALSLLYDLSLKSVYKLFPSKEIVKYYNIYHTFDIEEAAERMMGNIGYTKENYTQKGLSILKKLYLLDHLRKMIGKEVTVYVDRPLGSKHPKYDDIIYKANYGYIKEFIAPDGEYQDAYILGVDRPLKDFTGVVYCIINRTNDIEDKLIVVDRNETFSDEEIENMIAFQEKFFKHKIIKS